MTDGGNMEITGTVVLITSVCRTGEDNRVHEAALRG